MADGEEASQDEGSSTKKRKVSDRSMSFDVYF